MIKLKDKNTERDRRLVDLCVDEGCGRVDNDLEATHWKHLASFYFLICGEFTVFVLQKIVKPYI